MSESPKRQRTCIACGQVESKMDLYRIVRDAEGRVSFDATGRKAGRGAYVCSVPCFEKARTSRKLERALRVSVAQSDYDRIASDLQAALEGANGVEE